MRNIIVYYDKKAWAAIPANNGGNGPTWQWGEEILTGFTRGHYKKTESGHQCDNDRPFVSWLARSTDGGETWTTWEPECYAGRSASPQNHPGNPDFNGPGFVMRIEGAGYHGNSGSRWFYSENRGSKWNGPFGFGDLLSHPELEGKEFTGRTAYIINSSHDLFLFLTVRESNRIKPRGIALREKTFLARTPDRGKTFSFVAWVVPWSDPCRAAMPAPVRLSETNLVTAVRRKSSSNNWIDCFESSDNGMSWAFLSKVGDTETGNVSNGNPPGLITMRDGRLCCAYGNRTDKCILAKYSEDGGKTWCPAQILQNGFKSANGFPDLGYVRLFQRLDDKLLAVYFWCTEDKPQTHIEATIFNEL